MDLHVNLDHVATLRQARGTDYPSPAAAAEIALAAGASGITLHLREDRRHAQESDLWAIKRQFSCPLTLEMAATAELAEFASELQPTQITLVPERRAELTTEGGLALADPTIRARLREYLGTLAASGSRVSLFIDPEPANVAYAAELGAQAVELHTGPFALAPQARELARLLSTAQQATQCGLQVNAGHGLHHQNLSSLVQQPMLAQTISELHIGHGLVARAVLVGMQAATAEIKVQL